MQYSWRITENSLSVISPHAFSLWEMSVGQMDSCLYVSDYPDEWEDDRAGIKGDGEVLVPWAR